MPVILPSRISSFKEASVYPNPGFHQCFDSIGNLNFCDLGELRANWQLLAYRDPEKYDMIETAINQYPPEFLEAGYGYYGNYNQGALAFLLLSDYTSKSVYCCRRVHNPMDPSRYIEPSIPCGQKKYCLRCAFHETQRFVNKLKPHFNKKRDYFWVTITDPASFNFTNIGLTQELFEGIKGGIRKVRKRLLQIQSKRNSWIEGMVFAEEVACIHLLANDWNSHIHILIQSPKGLEPDLLEFELEGFNCDCRHLSTASEFSNRLRYLKKPITETIRQKYITEFDRSISHRLYRNAQQGIENVLELFEENHRCETTGCFRRNADS